MEKHITVPVTPDALQSLRAGDSVLLSGRIYTGRDAAHKRLCSLLDEGTPLPVPLQNMAIYYAGPCPAKPGDPIGSCGPTTSYRMDAYAPRLLDEGLRIMIGKGQRAPSVIDAMVRTGSVYLAATGGAGALIAGCVKSARVLAFPDLGTEAIRELVVENLPLIVAIDALGNDLYKTGPETYRQDTALPEKEPR